MATEIELHPRLLIRGMTWRIESFPFQVGRDPCCALRIDDPYLSRVQLQIEHGPAGYALLALGQAEVRHNGNAVQGRCALASGDKIAVHGFLATFLAPSPGAAAAAVVRPLAPPAAPVELPCEIVAEISQPPGTLGSKPTAPARTPGRVGSSRVPVARDSAGPAPGRVGSSRVAAVPDGAPARHRGATTKRTRILRVGPLRWQGRTAAAIGGWFALAAVLAGAYAIVRAVGPSTGVASSGDRTQTAQGQPTELAPFRPAEVPPTGVYPTRPTSPVASPQEPPPTTKPPTVPVSRPDAPVSAPPPRPDTPPPERDPPPDAPPPTDEPTPPAEEPTPPANDRPLVTPPDSDPARKGPVQPPKKRHPLDVDDGDEDAEWRGGYGSGSGEGGSIDTPRDPPDEPHEKYKDIPILGDEIRAKKIAFVIDRSGSMAKEWWAPVQRELCATIRQLTPDHEFNLYLFSNVFDDYAKGWARGTPEEIAKATAWVSGVEAKGATDPIPPLLAALSLKGIEALVLLSDIRFKGAKMDNAVSLLTRATRGTKTFKPIKLYYFPVEVNEQTARISALASGKPAESLQLRLERR